jgi:thymidylate synthase
MFKALNATTADSIWLKSADLFLKGGDAINQSSRAGSTVEILNAALCLEDPRQRWVASREPAMNPAFAIAEVVWILSGSNEANLPNYFNPALPKFAGFDTTYHGAYGYRLRNHFGFDQLESAFNALDSNRDTRQVVLQIWDSTVDLPRENGLPLSRDIPCNISSMLKVRDGRLVWTQIMRSNDLVRGFPHNVVQFTTLQEILAGWLNVEVGHYNHYSDSLHVYESDLEGLNNVEQKTLPLNLDNLSVEKLVSQRAIDILIEFCAKCCETRVSGRELLSSLGGLSIPTAYKNLALIMGADALRRRNAHPEMEEALSQCSNECLTFLFKRWKERKS